MVPQIREFGGELLVARGEVDALEGDWHPQSVTILRFDDRQSLMRWYDSPEYAPLKQMRLDGNAGTSSSSTAAERAAPEAAR